MADTDQELKRLADEVARLNGHRMLRVYNSGPRLLLNSFGNGLAFGLGTVLGGSILLSVLAYMVASIDFIPVVGEWAAAIAAEMEAAR